jgi:hypothetical protein
MTSQVSARRLDGPFDAMRAFAAGRLSQAELDRLGDEAVRETIAALEATGSPVITDGEQTKPSFATYPVHSLDAGAYKVQIDFTEGRLAVKLDPGLGLLRTFIGLNNRVLDRFSDDERSRLGVHTCPGGDRDSTHSADVDYAQLLPGLFELRVGNSTFNSPASGTVRESWASSRHTSDRRSACSSV